MSEPETPAAPKPVPKPAPKPVLEPPQTLFLQRQPYRRRRLIDAARVLPVFGAFLFFVPSALIARGTSGTTSAMGLFLFGTWIALIVAGALIARVLREPDTSSAPHAKGAEGKTG